MISITAMLQEIDRELAMRKHVYPGLVARGKMRESEAEVHVSRLLAVKITLQWLQRMEPVIKQRLADNDDAQG